jgi:hypothetical protein
MFLLAKSWLLSDFTLLWCFSPSYRLHRWISLARTVPGGIPHRWKMHLWPPGMELRKGSVQGKHHQNGLKMERFHENQYLDDIRSYAKPAPLFLQKGTSCLGWDLFFDIQYSSMMQCVLLGTVLKLWIIWDFKMTGTSTNNRWYRLYLRILNAWSC